MTRQVWIYLSLDIDNRDHIRRLCRDEKNHKDLEVCLSSVNFFLHDVSLHLLQIVEFSFVQ